MVNRHKDLNWQILCDKDGQVTWPQVNAAILMDIRDELKQLNRVFACPNFLRIPEILREVAGNTKKRARKRAKA